MRVLETHLKGNLYLCTDGLERGVNILTEKPLLYLSLPLQYSFLAEKTTNLSHRELQILKQFPEYISRHYACILTIRLIELLHTCPQYSTLVKKYSPAKFTPEYQKEIQGIFLVVSSYYQNTPQITPSHDIYSCIDYVLRNTFTVTDFELNPHGVALYQHSSYFNHSCEPNLHHYFNLATHEIIIRTIRKILPGEELCISYIDTGQPTLYRRRELYEKYQFYCMCSKCCVEDPLDHWKCSQSQVTVLVYLFE